MSDRRRRRANVCVWCVLLWSTLAGLSREARAQAPSSATDTATAEQLFLEGKRLLAAGQTASACEKLNASYAVEAGLGTMLLLGHCYEALGRTASAWAQFRSAASVASATGQPRRAEIARLRAAALEPRLSRLLLSRPSAGDSASYVILRNGKAVPLASLDVALPVDPGRQVIEVSAPGKQAQQLIVEVPAGPEITRVALPRLAAEKKRPNTKAAAPRQMPLARAASAPRASPSRVPVYVVGALGVAGVAVGATFGVLAKSAYDASDEFCRTETLCSRRGLELRETAEDRAQISTIAFAGGGALLGGALVIWLATPNPTPVRAGGKTTPAAPQTAAFALAPSVGTRSANLSLLGAW